MATSLLFALRYLVVVCLVLTLSFMLVDRMSRRNSQHTLLALIVMSVYDTFMMVAMFIVPM